MEILKQQRSESIQKIAHLKQQITEIETQENEAIREVSVHVTPATNMELYLGMYFFLRWEHRRWKKIKGKVIRRKKSLPL